MACGLNVLQAGCFMGKRWAYQHHQKRSEDNPCSERRLEVQTVMGVPNDPRRFVIGLSVGRKHACDRNPTRDPASPLSSSHYIRAGDHTRQAVKK